MKTLRNYLWLGAGAAALFLGVALVEAAGKPHAAKATFTTRHYSHPRALGYTPSAKSDAFVQGLPKRHLRRGVAVTIPKTVDLSPLVSPPENQGNCGSCWDFSLTKALRSSYMLAGKDPGVLAFNYLLNNCGPGPKMYGCGGGDFEAGDSFLKGAGPWLESQDPYTESEGRCKTGLKVAGTAVAMHSVGTGNNPPTFQELAEALSSRKMLSIDVAVVGSWRNYSSGIYSACSGGEGDINHMVNLVGFNCETSVDASGKSCAFDAQGKPINGDGYFILMNNWGTWGENGYMRTRLYDRSGNHCNAVATTAVYFEIDAPAPVDGGWTDFGPCVNGQQTRSCTNPTPANGGKDCVGAAVQSCTTPVPPTPPTPSGGLSLMTVLFIVALALALAFAVAFFFGKAKPAKQFIDRR